MPNLQKKIRKQLKNRAEGLDQLLAILPGDGDKTSISMAIKLLLPLLVPIFPKAVFIMPLLDALANVAIGVGATHKVVKKFTRDE